VTTGSLLKATRAFSLPASVLPVFVAVAAAVPAREWRWGVLLASAAGVALLHIAGNLLNDYFDYRRGVDRPVEGDESRPGQMIAKGRLLPRDEVIEGLVCLALAACVGAYLIWTSGLAMLWFGLAGVAADYVYTGPPLHLKYRAMGELVIFTVFGPLLMVGAAWAQTGGFELPALLASIPVGFATTAILTSGNLRDREEDSQAAIRTIARFARGRFAKALYLSLVPASVAGFVLIGATGLGPRGLVATVLAVPLMIGPVSAVAKGKRVAHIDALTAKFETGLLVLATVAYVVRW